MESKDLYAKNNIIFFIDKYFLQVFTCWKGVFARKTFRQIRCAEELAVDGKAVPNFNVQTFEQ